MVFWKRLCESSNQSMAHFFHVATGGQVDDFMTLVGIAKTFSPDTPCDQCQQEERLRSTRLSELKRIDAQIIRLRSARSYLIAHGQLDSQLAINPTAITSLTNKLQSYHESCVQ